jgi:acyl-CoA reductase-like NAD-dependent aldehyde dehydrogenase
LINKAALDKVIAHVKSATDVGAKVLCGGEVHAGLCYKPTLILEPPKDCDAWVKETFGPLACVAVVEDFEAALALANDNEYGLSAGILTNDMVKGMRAVREIRAGSVHVGMHSFQSDALAPIGGFKMSGLGKSGGHYSMEHFTEQKWASIELGESPIPPAWNV